MISSVFKFEVRR